MVLAAWMVLTVLRSTWGGELTPVRGCDELALVRGRGELTGVAGARVVGAGGAGAGEETAGAVAADDCRPAIRAPHPVLPTISAITNHPIRITGTSLPSNGRAAIRRAAYRPVLSDPRPRFPDMDWKIELIFIPVTDVDRAKAFYVDQVGFHADHDQTVNEQLRFVQLTPPGSACSIAFGTGITKMAPGSQQGVQVVVPDAAAARQHLLEHGVQASEVDEQPWGKFVTFADPDGNGWVLQELPARS